MTTAAAATPMKNLPEVTALVSAGPSGVTVEWEERGGELTAPNTELYSSTPYSFWAVNSNGDAPLIKTFGSLLHCDGGILTISEARYRIQVQRQEETQQQQQQQNDDTSELLEFVRQQKREAETLVLSKIKTEPYNDTIKRVNLKLNGAEWDTEPHSPPDIPMFTWLEPKEDNNENRRAYMTHLRQHFVWPDGCDVFDCNGEPDLLSVTEQGYFKASGNIDVVVALKKDIQQLTIRQNIRTGIELKKDTNFANHEKQVVLQHLAASTLNPDEGILTLMTDLNTRYHFYWFSRSKPRVLYKYMSKPAGAKFLLEHMFDNTEDSSESEFPTEFLDRGTWCAFIDTQLDTIAASLSDEQDDRNHEVGGAGDSSDNAKREEKNGDGGDSKRGSKRGSNMGGATQRATVHGNMLGQDVANELDLLDFYDEEEQRATLFRHVVQHSVPRMAYVPDEGDAARNGLSEADLRSHTATVGH
eukprot:scaffold21164_cov54-Attheya_sp.AAC.1